MPVRTAPTRSRRLFRVFVAGVLGLVLGVAIYLGAGLLTSPRPEEAAGWRLGTEMPAPRGETAVATTTDGRLFVIGGLTGVGFDTSGTVSVFEPGSGTWTAFPPLPEPRHHAAAAAIGNSVYVSGGAATIAGGTPRPEAWVLRAGSSAWERVRDMPSGRFGHRMVALGGRLFVVGGVDGPGETPGAPGGSVLVYDAVADEWSATTPIPLSRDHLAVVLVDGEIWAIGGRSNGQNHARVDIYDPDANEWREGPALPEPVSGAAEAAIGAQILVSGGEDPAQGIVDRHWTLDANEAAATWRAFAPPPLTVHGAPGAVVGGQFAIAGGASRAGGQSNTAWSGLFQVLIDLP